MKKAIPPELHAYVLQHYGEGKTGEEIAELLWREHKVEVSGRTTRKLLERYRSERADIAKIEVRGRLKKLLTADLDALEALHARARRYERRAMLASRKLRLTQLPEDMAAALKHEAFALKAQDRQLRAINLVLHYSGAGEPDQPELLKRDARAALVERLDRMIRAEATPEPGPKDDAVH